MDMNDYQKKAMSTRLQTSNAQYVLLNLAGEVGEVLSIAAKNKRDGVQDNWRHMMAKELGDVLWHVAALAEDLGWSLQDIAEENLVKLASRKQRGTIQGSGDDR